VFQHLRAEEADSRVVNLAGRQRMLAQGMAREALASAAGDRGAIERLHGLAEEFDRTLAGLLDGDPRRGLPPSAAAARERLVAVRQDWPGMARAIAAMDDTAADRAAGARRAAAVAFHADRLTAASDEAVSAFDAAFATRVRRLRTRMMLLGVGGAALLAGTYAALLADATRRTARAEAEVARKEAALQDLAEERRDLVRRLLSASEDERRRVATDIHDGPTQQLLGAAMLLEATIASGGAGPGLANMTTAQTYLEAAIEETRRIIADLRPPQLDDLGVTEALRRQLLPIAREFDVSMSFDTSGLRQRPAPRTEVVLYRVAHEAAINAIRHSGASRVCISVCDAEGAPPGIELAVTDEGSGFELAAVLASVGHRPFGLLGMRERVELLGGRFSVDSRLGEGTTVRAWIPAGGGGGDGA